VTQSSDWIEIRLVVPSDVEAVRLCGLDMYLEPLAERCLELCPGGLTIEDEHAPPGDETDGGRARTQPGTVRLTVYVQEAQWASVEAGLWEALTAYPGASLSPRPLDPNWRDRWKRWFTGFRVSEQLAVRPPWEEPDGPDEGLTLVIEPGMAFGTGQHETTWLCLENLEARRISGRLPGDMLDVGCGTGILSIAAARMGVSRVTGLDIDPDAIRCAQENAAANDVVSQLDLSTTPAAELSGTYPLVIANILGHILLTLARDLVARTAPGGALVLSGLLETQRAELLEAFEARGCRLDDSATRGPWTRLDMTRVDP
jgi:ribosomal protein L11 methyltransferase